MKRRRRRGKKKKKTKNRIYDQQLSVFHFCSFPLVILTIEMPHQHDVCTRNWSSLRGQNNIRTLVLLFAFITVSMVVMVAAVATKQANAVLISVLKCLLCMKFILLVFSFSLSLICQVRFSSRYYHRIKINPIFVIGISLILSIHSQINEL